MGPLPEGEVLSKRRLKAVVPLGIGLVFVGVGVWVMQTQAARGDASIFLLLWGLIWFIASGAAVVSGMHDLLRPVVFAVLGRDNVTFPAQRIGPIFWRDLVGVRLEPQPITPSIKTTRALRAPLILTVRNSAGDGATDIVVSTRAAPVSNEVLIRKLGERAGIAPDLASSHPQAARHHGADFPRPSSPPKKGWGIYFAAWAFLAFGLFFAAAGTRNLIHASASRGWQSTSAEILSSEVEPGISTNRRTGSSRTTYTPRISYRYQVAGNTYTSDRAAFIYNSSSRKAQTFVERFPPGAQVTAYYNPGHPAEAVLMREGYGTLWIFVVFGLLFASIGGFLLRGLLARNQGVA
jgi:hypothetical protein